MTALNLRQLHATSHLLMLANKHSLRLVDASILLALLKHYPAPVRMIDLQAMTATSRSTLRDHLKILSDLVDRTRQDVMVGTPSRGQMSHYQLSAAGCKTILAIIQPILSRNHGKN